MGDTPSRIVAGAIVMLLVATRAVGVLGHEIPSDVTLNIFVKPERERLLLVVRIPLITLNPQGPSLAPVELPTRGPGYLDLQRIDGVLRESALALDRLVDLYQNDRRLAAPEFVAARISLVSDRSFASYDEAVAHITGRPLPVDTQVYWNQGFLDAMLAYPIGSDLSNLSIHPKVLMLGERVTTVLRFLPANGGVRAYQLHGDPGIVRLDPRWHHAAGLFTRAGFSHILQGIDHLLFLCCLVIPVRRLRALIPVITSFTVAHSVTLMASAYDVAPAGAWFPPLVEVLIAASIVFMALENILGANLRRRWAITFAFGLIHGFGFSFALRDTLQFAGSHLLVSLVSFNVGIELGQLAVLIVMLPLLALLFRAGTSERLWTIVLSAFVAHSGWHWLLERVPVLALVEWPMLEILGAIRWVLVLALGSTLSVLFWRALQRRFHSNAEPNPPVALSGK